MFQKQRNQWICRSCSNKTVDKIYTQRSNEVNAIFAIIIVALKVIYGLLMAGKSANCAGRTNGISGEQMLAKIDAQLKSEKKKVTDMANKEKQLRK